VFKRLLPNIYLFKYFFKFLNFQKKGRMDSQSKQLDRQRRILEEKVIQSTRELTALKKEEVSVIEKSCQDQVKVFL
jgi:hypothetical protein